MQIVEGYCNSRDQLDCRHWCGSFIIAHHIPWSLPLEVYYDMSVSATAKPKEGGSELDKVLDFVLEKKLFRRRTSPLSGRDVQPSQFLKSIILKAFNVCLSCSLQCDGALIIQNTLFRSLFCLGGKKVANFVTKRISFILFGMSSSSSERFFRPVRPWTLLSKSSPFPTLPSHFRSIEFIHSPCISHCKAGTESMLKLSLLCHSFYSQLPN